MFTDGSAKYRAYHPLYVSDALCQELVLTDYRWGHELTRRLRTRLESREQRIDELEEQLARRSQVEEQVGTLAKRVEDQDEPAPPFPVRWWRWIRTRNEASP